MNRRTRQLHEPIRTTTHCTIVGSTEQCLVEFVYHLRFPVAVEMTIHQDNEEPNVWMFDRDLLDVAVGDNWGELGGCDLTVERDENSTDVLFSFAVNGADGALIAPAALEAKP